MQFDFTLKRDDFTFDIKLQLPETGITVLFGESGCGKTTLLRCIAGLEETCTGFCRVGDQIWQDEQTNLPAHQRAVGYVFQDASLFSHLNVMQNLRFGMKRCSRSSEESLQNAIEVLGIQHLLMRSPDRLSGGEAQRVAIARAIALNPDVLLLDEPLASLDHSRKNEIFPFLKAIKNQLNTPMLYVTHSADEVAMLADHLVVIENGTVKISDQLPVALSNIDCPLRLGDELSTVLTGRVAELATQWHLARVEIGSLDLWIPDNAFRMGEELRLQVLSKDMSVATAPGTSSFQNVLPGKVLAFNDDIHPSQIIVTVMVGSHVFNASITRRARNTLDLNVDQDVFLQIKSVAILS